MSNPFVTWNDSTTQISTISTKPSKEMDDIKKSPDSKEIYLDNEEIPDNNVKQINLKIKI